MRAPIRKSLRKWIVGAGCTLSVALLLQHARNSDAYSAVSSGADSNDSPAIQQQDPTAQDPVFQEWRNENGQNSDSGSGDESSAYGGRFGHRSGGAGGDFGGSDGSDGSGSSGSSGGGFRSRSGHS